MCVVKYAKFTNSNRDWQYATGTTWPERCDQPRRDPGDVTRVTWPERDHPQYISRTPTDFVVSRQAAEFGRSTVEPSNVASSSSTGQLHRRTRSLPQCRLWTKLVRLQSDLAHRNFDDVAVTSDVSYKWINASLTLIWQVWSSGFTSCVLWWINRLWINTRRPRVEFRLHADHPENCYLMQPRTFVTLWTATWGYNGPLNKYVILYNRRTFVILWPPTWDIMGIWK